jgi:hypothetical protein
MKINKFTFEVKLILMAEFSKAICESENSNMIALMPQDTIAEYLA